MSYRLKKSLAPKLTFFSSLFPVFNRILVSASGKSLTTTISNNTIAPKSLSTLNFLHNFTNQIELDDVKTMLTTAARLLADLNPEQTLVLCSVNSQEKEVVIAGRAPSNSLLLQIDMIRQQFTSENNTPNISNSISSSGNQSKHSLNHLTLVSATEPKNNLNQLQLYANIPLRTEKIELVNFCLTHLQKRLLEAQNWNKLEQANRIDSLTGLYNRRCFDELMQKENERSERYNHPTSVIMLDLDHFKKVNDNFGHQTGDLVLQRLGKILLDEVRQSDTPCRYGGEEFIIILPETGLEEARQIAERIRKTVARQSVETHNNVHLKFTASLGVASTEQANTDLVNSADQALYEAKNKGRNQVVSATSEIEEVFKADKSQPLNHQKNLDKPALGRCFQNLSMLSNRC